MNRAKRKILILELWGLGDLTFSTVLIEQALAAGDTVHLLGKPHAKPLLEPTFPSLCFFPFEAGWTKFFHKYRIWQWHWRSFLTLLWRLRKERYDVAVSARNDPRDHLLMVLIGARRRYGFPHRGSSLLLTNIVRHSQGPDQHKVQDWRDLGAAIGYPGIDRAHPALRCQNYRSERIAELFEGLALPVFVIHAGARIAVRRWPEAYFRELIRRLRQEFRFHLILIPDPDGYGSSLAADADTVLNDLSLGEMVNVASRCHLFFCNDSGPAHLAAAAGRPTVTFFGPGHSGWFHPWGSHHLTVIRDICQLRPCFDYCRFPEPYCMTRLTPEEIWPEVREHIVQLVAAGVLPSREEMVISTTPRLHAFSVNPLVVAIIATYRRPLDLARMLRSLPSPNVRVAAVVVDNAGDPETKAVTDAAGQAMEVLRLVPGDNLGCGGGLAYGERVALKHFAGRATHFLIADDDVELTPGTMERLVVAMNEQGAALACPMITWPDGKIGWFPGLLSPGPFDALRKFRVVEPEQYLERFGPHPVRFSWATGACLMVTRETLEELGTHRSDFWIRGEDFEFSLRITAQKPGIWVPDTHVRHYCYCGPQTREAVAAERRKQVAMLHNTAYISFHLPHGRRILRCLPGNLWRHVKNWGPGGIWGGLKAYWHGAVGAAPAGRQKVLVFAHTPPPHHGQSFMVRLMLDGLGGDARKASPKEDRSVACYHVNSRVSDGMEDIGSMRPGKAGLLLLYCLQAIWCRVRHGVRVFYYIPAPGKRNALYRDWIVMAFCRPFFPHVVFHWHASGLGAWLEKHATAPERWISRLLLGRPSLSIALAKASSLDAQWFQSLAVEIVPNGLPDPCPEFERDLLPCRVSRLEERLRALRQPAAGEPVTFRLLYMAHCTRDKGLFDALEGVALFNRRSTALRAHFTVAGAFMDADEEKEFRTRIAQPDLQGAVAYAGFVSGSQKNQLFRESDCLCFPTYYLAESFPLTLVEAAAYGLPSVATRWRAIPEIQPPDYPGFVEPKSPEQIAEALERLAAADLASLLRARFLSCFSEKSHLVELARALSGCNQSRV